MLTIKKGSKKRLTINAIQNGIFYMLFVLLPFSIIPTPWDWMERGTSILILIVSTVLVSLELLKFIWDGKFSISKNKVDIGILVVLIASTIATVFSVDAGLSFWGVDVNLGSGLLSLLTIILLTFVSRSFIDTIEEVVKVIIVFSIGVSIINILSIFSFLNIDFLSFLPFYKEVFTYGLPWTLSAYSLLVINGALSLTTFGLLAWSEEKSKTLHYIYWGVLSLSLITMLIFSISQGLGIFISFILSLTFLLILSWKSIKFKRSKEGWIKKSLLISLVLTIILFVIFKIPAVKDSLLDKFSLLTQLSLGNDITWEVVSSSISTKFVRAIVGFGENTFVILYNMFKPVSREILSFNRTNFYYGSSEIITHLSEGGLIWFFSWIFLGYLLISEFVQQVKQLNRSASSESSMISLTLGLSIIFIYLSSVFCHFGVLIKLIFFVFISLWVVTSNIVRKRNSEKFVLKMWAMETGVQKFKKLSKSIENVSMGMTIILGVVTIVTLGLWARLLISNLYISSAESYISSQSKTFEERDPSQQERDDFLTELLNRYSKAEKFARNNSLINRKLALLNLEKVSLYGEQYTFSDDQNEKDALLDRIAMHKREVVNHVQKSVDRNPQLYSSWETASSAYMGLLSIGFDDYDRDALNALGNAVDLNPSNYELYYNAAQVYLVQDNPEDSLVMLVKVLEINPSHIPSLIMAGEINKELGKEDVYLSYLKAAKAIMEEYGQSETDTYQDVVRDIRRIEGVEEETTQEDETGGSADTE